MTMDPARAAHGGIVQERRDEAVVLRLGGELDDAMADELRMRALEAHAPVIIDLDGCERFEGSAIVRLAEHWSFFRPQLCLVCSAVGDRRMLASSAASAPLPVFASVEEALAASAGGGQVRSTEVDGDGSSAA